MGSKSNFAAIFSVLPCFHARILPHFQVKPLPTIRFNAEISTTPYYSVITITSTTIINLLQPPLHWSVIESLFEINYSVWKRGNEYFLYSKHWFCKHFKPHFHVNLTKPVFAQHVKDKNKHPFAWCSAPCQNNPLRWLNTVLAVSEYMSLAKSWQEKGCSSQAETWQVKNIFYTDVFVVSMATYTIEYNLKISLWLSLHKICSLDFPINLHTAYYYYIITIWNLFDQILTDGFLANQ